MSPQGPDPLPLADAERRAEQLRRTIRRHDHLYYVLDRPEITDADYDGLFRHLVGRGGAGPSATSPSPSSTASPSSWSTSTVCSPEHRRAATVSAARASPRTSG